MYLIHALLIGIICGSSSAILGTIIEEVELGMLGFIAAIISAIIYGPLAIPVSVLFVIFILTHISSDPPKRVLADVIPFNPKSNS